MPGSITNGHDEKKLLLLPLLNPPPPLVVVVVVDVVVLPVKGVEVDVDPVNGLVVVVVVVRAVMGKVTKAAPRFEPLCCG
jgi:hypothetical protein